MASLTVRSERKARVVLIGAYRGWGDLAAEVLPDYADGIDLRVVQEPFEQGMETGLRLARDGEVDVFMSTNLTAEELRAKVGLPVVQIKITGFEILHALVKASELTDNVALFSYGTINFDIEHARALLKLDIRQYAYDSPTEAGLHMDGFADRDRTIVVGSGAITELARKKGLRGIFVHGIPSMRQAMGDALEISRLVRSDAAKRERLNAIVRHLKEGVLAVDANECVQLINPAMEQLLGVHAASAVGRPLADLSSALRLDATLQSGVAEHEVIQQVGARIVVASRVPIREEGIQTGAVLTVQDASSVQRADRNIRAQARHREFKAKYRLDQVVGASPAIALARRKALSYAASDSTVLITGESGTGKELFAQGIHNASKRREQAFVAINCPAVPEMLLESELFGYEEGAFTGARRGGKMGLFEAAHTGTIFLDEIGDMPVTLQARLLRVLQEREILRVGGQSPIPVDVRVIAATNCDLRANIESGTFRKDLYYRLNILHLGLPPLTQRKEDVAELAAVIADAILRRTGSELKIDDFLPHLVPHFERYSWPGNVREMENVIERAVAVMDPMRGAADPETIRGLLAELFVEDLAAPRLGSPGSALRAKRVDAEGAIAREMVEACGGDLASAAKRLGISRTTLWRKLNPSRA